MLFKLLNGAASPANCARKIAGPLMVLIIPSTPPCIHDEVLCRTLFRRVRSQEQRHVRDVAGKHPRLQTLPVHYLFLELRLKPQFDLPLSPDRPGRKCVHPYAECPKFSRQHPRQPGDGSLGHVVYREARLLDPPNNGAKIDNGPSAESLHLRRHRLRREKHVPHVHRDPLIPILRRDLIYLVTFVVRGIIDEHADVAQLDADFFDSGLQCGDVPEVAGDEKWRRSHLFLNLSDQRPARFLRNIHETHAGPLRRERARESRTNAASSTGNEHRFVSEARVACRSARIHISQPLCFRRETLLYPFSISKQTSTRPRFLRRACVGIVSTPDFSPARLRLRPCECTGTIHRALFVAGLQTRAEKSGIFRSLPYCSWPRLCRRRTSVRPAVPCPSRRSFPSPRSAVPLGRHLRFSFPISSFCFLVSSFEFPLSDFKFLVSSFEFPIPACILLPFPRGSAHARSHQRTSLAVPAFRPMQRAPEVRLELLDKYCQLG